MQFHVKKLQFDKPENIDKIFINYDNTMALTDKCGKVLLYSNEEENNPMLITNYQDHKALIMDLAFAPFKYPFHVLTCSYDRSISIRSQSEQVFFYKETEPSCGFFVCCTFVNTESDSLRFLVGNSNGYLFDFNTQNNFIPTKHALFSENILALEAIDNECILVCSNGHMPRIYVDYDFQDYLEIESDFTKDKYKLAKITGNKREAKIILVNHENCIEIYRFDRENHSIIKEAQTQSDNKILAVAWNFSGHSINLFGYDNKFNEFDAKILKENLEMLGTWDWVELNREKLE